MTATVTKFVSYGLTGKATGIEVAKFTGYVLLIPGVEAGVTPPKHNSYTYGQLTKKPSDD